MATDTAKWSLRELPDMDAHDDSESDGRTTSPMQSYSMREVGIGFVVLAVGLLVAYLLPALA